MAVSCDGHMAAYGGRDSLTTVTKPLPSASRPLSTARGDTRKASRPGMMVMAPSRGHHPPVASQPLSMAPRPRTMASRPSTTVMTFSRQSRIPTRLPHGRYDGPKASHYGRTAS